MASANKVASGTNSNRATTTRSTTMSKFDLNKAVARETVTYKRQECTTLESSLNYINDRLVEMRKHEPNQWGWIEKDEDGSLYVVVELKTMPIFWRSEKDASEMVEIKHWNKDTQQLEVVETRELLKGYPRFPVASYDEGVEFIEYVAKGEDAAINERISIASEAYKDVVNVEQEEVNKYAEVLYNQSKWPTATNENNGNKPYLVWSEQDEVNEKTGGMKFSTGKTNKKNMFKQKARRHMGYERWNEHNTKHRTGRKYN